MLSPVYINLSLLLYKVNIKKKSVTGKIKQRKYSVPPGTSLGKAPPQICHLERQAKASILQNRANKHKHVNRRDAGTENRL